MTCYHPLRAVVLGTNAETGKKRIHVLADSDFSYEHSGYEYITIPCGHCIGCRLKYSRIWADRCMLEAIAGVRSDVHAHLFALVRPG